MIRPSPVFVGRMELWSVKPMNQQGILTIITINTTTIIRYTFYKDMSCTVKTKSTDSNEPARINLVKDREETEVGRQS
jgi:hypothetical protein